MKHNFEYIHFDDEENEHIYDVEYTMSKYIPATHLQPEEKAEVEVTSIEEDGIEIEVDEETMRLILEKIEVSDSESEYENEDW